MLYKKDHKGVWRILWFTVFIVIFGVMLQSPLYAGDKEKQKPKRRLSDKVYLGGYFGLQFGTVTDILLAPLVGYRATPRLTLGGGFKYEYYRQKTPGYSYSTNMYGPNLFVRYMFLKSFSNIFPTSFNGGLFAQTEYEALNMESEYFGLPGQEKGNRFWMNSWFIGGGFHQPLGRRSAVNILFMFYIGNNEYTPYSNPIIRVEFGF